MLNRLSIRHIAILDALDLSFEQGLTVVTGETGAGKSLIVDCLGMVFGERVSPKTWLKHGQARGQIEVAFSRAPYETHPVVVAALEQAGVELWPEDKEIVLLRELSASGSRYRLNGSLIGRDVIAGLRDVFLQAIGQHEVHQLFSPTLQRAMLDELGGEPMQALKDILKRTVRHYQELKKEYDTLIEKQMDRERQLEWMQFQLDEITAAELSDPDEDQHCRDRRETIQHQETLIKSAHLVHALIQGTDDPGDPCLLSTLSRVQRAVHSASAHAPLMSDWVEELDEIEARLDTIARESQAFGERLSYEPSNLDDTVERLDQLEKLKRKYGGTLAAVIETAQSLQKQVEQLETAHETLATLEADLKHAHEDMIARCQALTDLRKHLAQQLMTSMATMLSELELPHACFDVTFEAIAPGEDGADAMTFMFSANPGDPIKPLQHVASGGELARLLLAFKLLSPALNMGQLLVLDEADTGMSGVTLRAVAEKLEALSLQNQMIVVTHQPIVAAKGQHHLHLIKSVIEGQTQVQGQWLQTPQERSLVLGRLASGVSHEASNQAAQAYVEELMKQ